MSTSATNHLLLPASTVTFGSALTPANPALELWLTERHDNLTAFSFKANRLLYHAVSPFQSIDIVETDAYGRMLLLDGLVMTTERDEFIYHEMISHIPLLAHPNPKQVLVIGGGDGGTVREVLRHSSVERVVLCEIDTLVVDACIEHLPTIAGALSDPRVSRQDGDGVALMADLAKHNPGQFDAILIDATDPMGPGEGLFTEDFYNNVATVLSPNGVMATQSESPIADQHEIALIYPLLRKVFPVVQAYTAPIPTYPSGYWSWAFCSKGILGHAIAQTSLAQQLADVCKYYNPAIQQAAFALPNFVKHLIGQ
jgi:spermidine synthase